MHPNQPLDIMIGRQTATQAYRCWERRGRPLGSPEVDWYRAVEDLKRESEWRGFEVGTIATPNSTTPEIAKMNLDRALELAVVSSWKELIHPREAESIRVEYRNIVNLPLDFVEVWMVKNRGYGMLICRYSPEPSKSSPGIMETPALHFANSYCSKTLAENLDFIFRNQQQFTRSCEGFVHGLVQIDSPSIDDHHSATAWSVGIRGRSTDGLRAQN